jgi:hypothetical protein
MPPNLQWGSAEIGLIAQRAGDKGFRRLYWLKGARYGEG